LRLKLKTAPTVEPISLDEAKLHLKVDGADDNALITALITTARQLAERETGRAFITQTWQMYLDAAPAEIEIPKPPLQSVTAITVIDDEGAETVVSDTLYDVDASQNSPGRVKLKSWCSWPTHREFASFIIEFKAGYGDAATDVPETLKQGILQLVAHLYENRGAEEIPKGIKAIFWPFMILRI
jgi:uncharacterized phiE125 gp8 family phage protein